MIILEWSFWVQWEGIDLLHFLSVWGFDGFAGILEDVLREDKFVLIDFVIKVPDESEDFDGGGVYFLVGSLDESGERWEMLWKLFMDELQDGGVGYGGELKDLFDEGF